MTDRERRQQTRREEEDAVFNRMLLWVGGAAVAELLVLGLEKLHVEMVFGAVPAQILFNVFRVFSFLGIALGIACAVWMFRRVQAGQPIRVQAILLVVDVFFWIVSVLTWRWYDVGLELATLLPIVVAVLILIYFLYQRVFFVSSLFTAYGLAVLWCYRSMGQTTGMHRAVYLSIVLMAAACVGVYFLAKQQGKVLGLRVLPYDTAYSVLYISAIVNAVAFLAVRIAGPGAAIYLVFALAAWLFAEVVYFTVKIM